MMKKKSIHSDRRPAVITGVLLLVGLVAGLFSVVPVIDGADYLAKASTHENQVLIGALSQLLMVIAYVGTPIVLYPILSKHHKGVALGSVAFGIIAGVFIMMGVIVLLLLLDIKPRIFKPWSFEWLVCSDPGRIVKGRTRFGEPCGHDAGICFGYVLV